MKNFIKILSVLFALAVAPGSFAQVIPTVQNSFNQYSLNTLQEKLFVHTDKGAYTAGELMWFKIYNVDGMHNRPLDLSKVAYVEVLDNDQNAVLQAKIALNNGSGSGSLFIPISLSTGNFTLRAYTGWMKNFSPEYYFSKKISIVNPLKSPDAAANTIKPAEYSLNLFPEGGNLVNGLTSVVGFKLTDKWGHSVNFKGAIIDQKQDTVVRFQPLKFGMGHFSFKPDAGNTYDAVAEVNGKTIATSVVLMSPGGYVMNLKDDGSAQLQVTVTSTSPTGDVYLFAHTRNMIKVVQDAALNNGTATFSIEKSKLGDGISHLTIFNGDKQPVCERLYFKRPVKNLVIDAVTDQPQYATRKKVSIDIDAKDQNNRPVAADLSLSVYRIDSLQNTGHEDIRNYLWLTSDLRGNIESPGYYFKNNDAETNEAIDNLMLTQGWSRFNWNDVLKDKAPVFAFLPEYNGPIITAKITTINTGKPAKDIIAYLSIPGKSVQMYASRSDSMGRLVFNMKNFYGPGEIVAETNTNIDTNYHIDVLSPFSEQHAVASLPALTLTPGMRSTVENNSLAMQVQNIYNGNKLRNFYDPQVDSTNTTFYGAPDKTYLLDNYVRFATTEEVMREYVHEVVITNTHGHFHIKVLSDNGLLQEDDPMVFIDGVPFFNIDKVFAANPLKIRKLDVVPYMYFWGPSVEAGIFSFTTYKGDMGGNEIDPHAVVLDYEGLELQREFYSPVYDNDVAAASRVPDFRNVLYWAPYISITTKGKNSLSFYTSDQAGTYMGVIQGITPNGEAGSQYFMFEVKK